MSDLEIMNLPDFKKDLEKILNLSSSINKIEYYHLNLFLDKKDHRIKIYYYDFFRQTLEVNTNTLTLNLEKDGIILMIKHYRRELIIDSLL